ncbi:MAG: laccase domain-containing protein [Candidatus Zixiibacteriota bacterium]|nr:MAG: laccase domain-containing protein [candidate division Zixibacteria bacterium]
MNLLDGEIRHLAEGGRYMDFSKIFGGGKVICGMSLRNEDAVSPGGLVSFLPKGTKMITSLQTHSSIVSLIREGIDIEVTPLSDAMVIDRPNVCLTVSVADCLPLYLYHPDVPAIGLAHLGWRGLVAGIVENCVECLSLNFNCSADRVEALLGPSIGRCCYQVSPEVAVLFPEDSSEIREGRLHLDLRAITTSKLTTCGLSENNIFSVQNCTSCERELFFSYRVEGKEVGRMLAFIQIRG